MKFEELYKLVTIEEARFRKSKYIKHLADFPMFSVFVSKSILENPHTGYDMEFFENIKSKIGEACEDARNQIAKIGFRKMHVNVVIEDLDGQDVAGQAFGRRIKQFRKGDNEPSKHMSGTSIKYIKIDLKTLLRFNKFTTVVLVHEWAHVWMFNNSKQFKDAVETFYKSILSKGVENVEDIVNYVQSDKKFTPLEETQIINSWKNCFSSLSFSPVVRSLLISKIKLTSETIKYIPHGISIYNLVSTKDITCLDGYLIKAGTYNVYIIKGSPNFIVGVYDSNNRHRRHETVMNSEDIIKHFDTNEIVEKFKQRNRTYIKEILSKDKKFIYDTILIDVTRGLENTFNNIPGYRKKRPLEYWKSLATEWTRNYIYPKFKKLKISEIKSILNKPDVIYDYLWVSNELKPDGLSVVKLMEDMYKENQLIKNKSEVSDKLRYGDLTGRGANNENTNIRIFLRDVAKWSGEYGMSNDQELWATAIEDFFKLPMEHRKTIIKLITQNR